jgi:5-methylcytosine-specific restriction enzyme subunit McrC
VDISESRASVVPIDEAHAQALERLGQLLVSKEDWWGASAQQDDEGEEIGSSGPRTAIRCNRGADGRWRVTVANRLGLISVGDLLLRVLPKLSPEHVTWIFTQVPQLGSALASADAPVITSAGAGFWEIVAHSYLWAAERVLRSDLMRDYQERHDELSFVRGKIQMLPTTRNLVRGRMTFSLEFEEFSVDTPLNRVLRAAAHVVAASKPLDPSLRKRATRVVARMEDVGELRPSDLRELTIDRRTGHYRAAIDLSKLLLRAENATWTGDGVQASAFLIRTPDLIERGVRNVLDAGLRPAVRVSSGSFAVVSPPNERLNPDLVFGSPPIAVGDVKYKKASDKWLRPDVYEVTAFATHSRVRRAAIVDFTDRVAKRPDFIVGDICVRQLAWDLRREPIEAAQDLISQARAWLEELAPDESVLAAG